MISRRTSVVDRATVADVLRFAGRPAADARGWFRCPSGTHLDEHPSAHVVDERGWKCHACGGRGGLLELGRLVGLGGNRAEVARELERRLAG